MTTDQRLGNCHAPQGNSIETLKKVDQVDPTSEGPDNYTAIEWDDGPGWSPGAVPIGQQEVLVDITSTQDLTPQNGGSLVAVDTAQAEADCLEARASRTPGAAERCLEKETGLLSADAIGDTIR